MTVPDKVSTHQLVAIGCRHESGPASVSENDRNDIFMI